MVAQPWQPKRYPRLHQRRANAVFTHALGHDMFAAHTRARYDAEATYFTTETPSRRRVKHAVAL
jgi:hypothetical protein